MKGLNIKTKSKKISWASNNLKDIRIESGKFNGLFVGDSNRAKYYWFCERQSLKNLGIMIVEYKLYNKKLNFIIFNSLLSDQYSMHLIVFK